MGKKPIKPNKRTSPAFRTVSTLKNQILSKNKNEVIVQKRKREVCIRLKNTIEGLKDISSYFRKFSYDTMIETKKFFNTAIKDGQKFKFRMSITSSGDVIIREKRIYA